MPRFPAYTPLSFAHIEDVSQMTNSQGLYWESGPYNSGIQGPALLLEASGCEALELIGEFLSACQKQHFAYNSGTYGVQKQRELFGEIFRPEHRDNTFFIGTRNPDEEQFQGRALLGQIRQGEFLDSLCENGIFQDYHAKALVVMIYHLWDEYYRPLIADALSVEASKVKCTLMGDLRRVRNLIIHDKSHVSEGLPSQLEFLPQIWSIEPGDLSITIDMVHSLMEQLNSIRVTVDNP